MYELGGVPQYDASEIHEPQALYAEVYVPVILVTDLGRFEIDYSESSTVFMAKDTIPPELYCSALQNPDSYDSDRAFSILKGQKIIAFQVQTQGFKTADDEFTGSYGIGLPEDQKAYIKELQFMLSSGQRLVFQSTYDWGYVSVYEANDELAMISAQTLRQCGYV